MEPQTYWASRVSNINQEVHVDLEGGRVTLNEIHRNTDYYVQELRDWSEELLCIQGVEIGLK